MSLPARFWSAPPAPGKDPPANEGDDIETGVETEDMKSGHAPAKAKAELQKGLLFTETDAKLQEYGKHLMEACSWGDLETVALEVWDRFCKATGGTYTNPKLDTAVREHDATVKSTAAFEKKLREAVLDAKCNLNYFPPLRIGRYAFKNTVDK